MERMGIMFGFQEKLLYLIDTGDMAYNKLAYSPKNLFLKNFLKIKKIRYVVARLDKTTITAGPTGLKLASRRKGAIK